MENFSFFFHKNASDAAADSCVANNFFLHRLSTSLFTLWIELTLPGTKRRRVDKVILVLQSRHYSTASCCIVLSCGRVCFLKHMALYFGFPLTDKTHAQTKNRQASYANIARVDVRYCVIVDETIYTLGVGMFRDSAMRAGADQTLQKKRCQPTKRSRDFPIFHISNILPAENLQKWRQTYAPALEPHINKVIMRCLA